MRRDDRCHQKTDVSRDSPTHISTKPPSAPRASRPCLTLHWRSVSRRMMVQLIRQCSTTVVYCCFHTNQLDLSERAPTPPQRTQTDTTCVSAPHTCDSMCVTAVIHPTCGPLRAVEGLCSCAPTRSVDLSDGLDSNKILRHITLCAELHFSPWVVDFNTSILGVFVFSRAAKLDTLHEWV